MKPVMILIFVLCAFFYATYRYLNSTLKDEGNIAHFENGLKGAFKYLSNKSKINFICPNDDVQQILEARYVLFPIILDFEKDQQYDTALIVVPANDSNYQDRSTVIWKNDDEKFKYYLIKKT